MQYLNFNVETMLNAVTLFSQSCLCIYLSKKGYLMALIVEL